MVISNQILFDSFFYTCLASSLALSLAALFVFGQKRRMIFLFLFYIVFSLVTFLLFSRILVFIVGFIFSFFYLLLLVFSYNEGFFERNIKKTEKKNGLLLASGITNLVMALALCAGLGYTFYAYTTERFEIIRDMKNFSFISLDKLLERIFDNYLLIVMIIIIVIFSSVLWFTVISQREKDKKEDRL